MLGILRSAAPAVEGADVPDAAADDVAELELEPLVALDVARVEPEPEPEPEAAVCVGSVTVEPLAAAEPALVAAGALVTVGTDAAGVTWI